MILQYNEIRELTIYTSFFLWILCIIVAFLTGIYTLFKIKSRDNHPDISELQRINVITWGIAYVLMGFVLLLFTLWYYFIEDQILASIVDRILVFLFHIAIFIKILDTEYTINKHKIYKGYYCSFIVLGLAMFCLAVPPPVIRSIILYQYIYLGLFVSGISVYFISFLIASIKCQGEERKNAIKMLIFPIMIVLGVVFLPYNVEVYYQPLLYFDLIYLLPQILMISRLILMHSTYSSNLKK